MRKVSALILALSASFLFSCGGKGDNPTPADNETSWKLGDYTYVKGGSSQSSQANDGKTITGIAVTTSGDGGNYGAFSGSSVTITFYSSLGEGTYTLGTTEAMVANPGSKIMNLDCTIGTAVSTGAVMYDSSLGGTAEVTKDSNGKFHVTVSTPITLTKKVTTGGGIPAAKDSYQFTLKNAN